MVEPNSGVFRMAQLGWFFAGTSFGLFFGVLLTSLGKISDMAREQELLQADSQPRPGRLIVMHR
jgi:hypothetical protein